MANTVSDVKRLTNKDMVRQSVSKMKIGMAAGPPGLKSAGEAEFYMLTNLINQIIVERVIPGVALERRNYRGLKLTSHILKIVERGIVKATRQQI